MSRYDDDLNRRRLRGLYDRNRRRVFALAEARDRNSGDRRDDIAPRSFVVSERASRLEGFGRRRGRDRGLDRDRVQVRRVVRIIRDRPRRFEDRSIYSGSYGRERFIREADLDRYLHRERFRERRLRGPRSDRRDRERGYREIIGSRRRLRRANQDRPRRRGGDGDRQRDDRRRGDGSKDRGNRNHKDGGRREQNSARRGRGPAPTRDELDSQLDRYHNN